MSFYKMFNFIFFILKCTIGYQTFMFCFGCGDTPPHLILRNLELGIQIYAVFEQTEWFKTKHRIKTNLKNDSENNQMILRRLACQ